MLFDLDLLLAREKGSGNPFRYYPDTYLQASSQSIIDSSGKYDMAHFSKHEADVIQDVVKNSAQKYPENLFALGLVNESYVITYKPRSVLFEIVTSNFQKSNSPKDQFAVAFAYSQKGAAFRTTALEYFEQSVNKVSFRTLDMFASLSSSIAYLKFSELYEQEHNYEAAVLWLKKAIKRGGLNNNYLKQKIFEISSKDPCAKRKSSRSKQNAELEKAVNNAAIYFTRQLSKEGVLLCPRK